MEILSYRSNTDNPIEVMNINVNEYSKQSR